MRSYAEDIFPFASCLHLLHLSDFCTLGTQPGLVSPDEGHVVGQQWRRWGAEWNSKPPGKAWVHHETRVQPLRPADWAQGAGWLTLTQHTSKASLQKPDKVIACASVAQFVNLFFLLNWIVQYGFTLEMRTACEEVNVTEIFWPRQEETMVLLNACDVVVAFN